MSVETKTSMDKVNEFGLISEFSYLTIESKFFQEISKDSTFKYSNENIKKYFQSNELQIENQLGNVKFHLHKLCRIFISSYALD